MINRATGLRPPRQNQRGSGETADAVDLESTGQALEKQPVQVQLLSAAPQLPTPVLRFIRQSQLEWWRYPYCATERGIVTQMQPILPGTTVPPTVYVTFSAEIVPHTTESLIATMSKLVSQKIEKVHLLISTPGGSVMHGMNLYNVLRAMPIELTTHNVGNVDSIGNAVFLAGRKRYACPHSTFMFHGVGTGVPQGVLEEKSLREKLQSVQSDQRRISAIIAERTRIAKEDAERLFLEMQSKDAAFAVSCGIVDEVRDVEIPKGCPILSLVFQR